MFLGDARRLTSYWMSIAALVVCAVLNGIYLVDGATVYTFGNMFVGDPMANLLKLATSIAMIATLVYSHDYLVDRGIVSGERGGEFYPLVLFAILGQFVMISANNFLAIYLGLELMSLAFYALVALRRDHTASTEAAMKYFILGALSSGFLLYGMSMLYGATGTLDLTMLARQLDAGRRNRTILVFGLVFIVAGLGFKLGAVPFHMWIPDVYQGAPSAITLVVGGAPKLAAFAIVFRLLVEGMISLAFDWQQMLTILAVLSLALGNLAAIAQTSVKRMLGYSTISHMGFLLLGMLAGIINGNAYSAASCLQLGAVLRGRLRPHHVRGVRRVAGDVAQRLRGRSHRRLQGPLQAQPLGRDRHVADDVLARRRAAHGRLLREVLGAVGRIRDRIGVAGRVLGDDVARRRVLLPAHRQADVLRRAGRDRGDRGRAATGRLDARRRC